MYDDLYIYYLCCKMIFNILEEIEESFTKKILSDSDENVIINNFINILNNYTELRSCYVSNPAIIDLVTYSVYLLTEIQSIKTDPRYAELKTTVRGYLHKLLDSWKSEFVIKSSR